MSKGSGGKAPSGSQPGRPAADTPQRLVVRSLDPEHSDSQIMGSDTAVAVAAKKEPAPSGTASTKMSTLDEASSPSPSSTSEMLGSTLSGKYLVTKKVGQGGMGAVYEATHTVIGKRVAIKVLLEKYAQREAIVKRLKQEAQLASSIGNEHIIEIFDIGHTDDGRMYVVMEFLEGESLAECLARETQLSEQRILRIMAQSAGALAAAHAKGIVHRDIKPENLFLLRRKDTDFVKVVDFGISKSLRSSGEEEETTRLTQTGMVLGTPLYMSPEQARGNDELDHRVDVYALGVIMYEAATGRVPFVGSNYLSVISQVLNETPVPLRELRPDLSEEFEAVVAKAMAKDVKDRYESATAMAADINALLEDPTHSTERARITGPRRKLRNRESGGRYLLWFAGIAVIIAAVVVSVTQMLGSSSKRTGPGDGSGSAEVVVPVTPPVDAAVAAVVVDAVPVPETELIEVKIETTPPGAQVFVDGVPKSDTTPMTIRLVKKDRVIELVARLDGHNDYPFKINPVEHEEAAPVKLTLVKPKTGNVIRRPIKAPPTDDKKASGGRPGGTAGGDFAGDPYKQ